MVKLNLAIEYAKMRLCNERGSQQTDYLLVIGMVATAGLACWAVLSGGLASLTTRIETLIGTIF